MTCTNIDGVWYAVIKTPNKVYMGYSPSINQAMDFCAEEAFKHDH